jgi:predicted membrane chloride channel (bestrophin family)
MKKFLKMFALQSKWKLAIWTVPFVLAIILFKSFIHFLGYEFLSLNSLFTAVISANVFLVGFLISGTLVDYKESEKIPGDIATSLETMADEGFIIFKNKKTEESKKYLNHLLDFSNSLINWFYKKEKTNVLMEKLFAFNNFFLVFENQTQANFIVRLKQEQNSLRKMINRVHAIRETSFLSTGYAIVEILTFLLIFGFIFIKVDPFYESIFFVSFVSFMLIYMIFFIKDLDNPFGYSQEDNMVEEVSLKLVLDARDRIAKHIKEIG